MCVPASVSVTPSVSRSAGEYETKTYEYYDANDALNFNGRRSPSTLKASCFGLLKARWQQQCCDLPR
jgi:hypothetical protein